VGKRCHGIFDWGAKGRTNAIGALIKGALLTVALFPCNINADVFYAWAAQDLVPKLPAGSIVVMDNAAFHKREDIKSCIEKAGHTLKEYRKRNGSGAVYDDPRVAVGAGRVDGVGAQAEA
jgi:hypothetical protein